MIAHTTREITFNQHADTTRPREVTGTVKLPAGTLVYVWPAGRFYDLRVAGSLLFQTVRRSAFEVNR